MGLFATKTADAICLPHYSGVPNFPENCISELILHDDKLEIKPKYGKNPSVYLPFEKIIAALHTSEKEIQDKGKSVLGRAVVGGVLLGPLGALIGSMSGVGKKQTSQYKFYVVINYKPSPDRDIETLCFVDNTLSKAGNFIKILKEKTGIDKKEITL